MKALRILFGCGLIFFALVLGGVAFFGVDPVGSQMADDGDPFGHPKAKCSRQLY